jgi:hypothetical protein
LIQVEALPASDVRCGAARPRELRRMGREESRLGWQMVPGRGSIWGGACMVRDFWDVKEE